MNYKKIIFLFIVLTIVVLPSCERYYNPGLNIKEVQEDTIKIPEIEALIKYINNSGDYINSKAIPNMVSADNVYDNLSSYYVIDIRSHEEYVAGHINGAVNVKPSEILHYLNKKVSPIIYDKLVIACHSGQTASYVTSILRLVGYNNVYAMKYGMGAWNRSLDKWSSNISNKYANSLEIKINPKGKITAFPEIKTGKHCGAEILHARAVTVLNTPFSKLKINADRAFSDSSFYIVNYWPKDRYVTGHIPGAKQYTPKKDLNDTVFLNTLPTDKKILVYCFTGQHSAFVVAYLRLLGYNAFTLKFGANSFMHNKLISHGPSWHGFVAADKLNDFPLISGEEPTDKKINVGKTSSGNNTPKKKKKIVRRKKKEVEGGCG